MLLETNPLPMGQDFTQFSTKRRFPRVHGPFFGFYETPQTPVLVYDLNLGGGFVNFGGALPNAVDFWLSVSLPQEGMITVHAETVYRHESGVAVRFVDLDIDTSERLARTVGGPLHPEPAH
jgi:hypothetical protein